MKTKLIISGLLFVAGSLLESAAGLIVSSDELARAVVYAAKTAMKH